MANESVGMVSLGPIFIVVGGGGVCFICLFVLSFSVSFTALY